VALQVFVKKSSHPALVIGSQLTVGAPFTEPKFSAGILCQCCPQRLRMGKGDHGISRGMGDAIGVASLLLTFTTTVHFRDLYGKMLYGVEYLIPVFCLHHDSFESENQCNSRLADFLRHA
jgi:hypothetical protein